MSRKTELEEYCTKFAKIMDTLMTKLFNNSCLHARDAENQVTADHEVGHLLCLDLNLRLRVRVRKADKLESDVRETL